MASKGHGSLARSPTWISGKNSPCAASSSDTQHRWADKTPGKLSETMGWSTTWKRKEWAVGWLLKLITDRETTIHDAKTYDEMRTYVTLPNGGYGPADRAGYDDCVMAYAIACICAATEGPLLGYAGPLGEAADELPIRAPWEQWGEGAAS